MSTNFFARARAMESTDACHLSLLSSNHVPENRNRTVLPERRVRPGKTFVPVGSASSQYRRAIALVVERCETPLGSVDESGQTFTESVRDSFEGTSRGNCSSAFVVRKRRKTNGGEDSGFRVGDEGRRERQHRGDVVEGETIVRGRTKVFGKFDVV